MMQVPTDVWNWFCVEMYGVSCEMHTFRDDEPEMENLKQRFFLWADDAVEPIEAFQPLLERYITLKAYVAKSLEADTVEREQLMYSTSTLISWYKELYGN